ARTRAASSPRFAAKQPSTTTLSPCLTLRRRAVTISRQNQFIERGLKERERRRYTNEPRLGLTPRGLLHRPQREEGCSTTGISPRRWSPSPACRPSRSPHQGERVTRLLTTDSGSTAPRTPAGRSST